MTGPNIGAALKAIRLYRGLSLDHLAEETRVRGAYLAAIENFRLDQLPSRPFTVGYVRAYAQALGLDGEAAVERFRADDPLLNEGLSAPIGVDHSDRRIGVIVVAAILLVASIVAWNIAQRSAMEDAPTPPSTPARSVAGSGAGAGTIVSKGYVELGAPLPAPVESTAPAPYETPGLAKAMSGLESPVQDAPIETVASPQMGARFEAKGPVLGALPAESQVIIQARKSAALIVRGPDGTTYFARQLAVGQAYRVPNVKGLTLEAFDAGALQIFVAGESRGAVPAGKSSVAQLTPTP